MKRALCIFFVLIVLYIPQTVLAYYGMDDIPYNIVLAGNSLEEAVCQAALIFHSFGYWEDAEVFTAGCKILESQAQDTYQLISAVVAVCKYDTDDGTPREVGFGCYPVKLSLSNRTNGMYSLLSYLFPEDGGNRSKQYRELFSDSVYSLLSDAESKNELYQYARSNALDEAKKFICAHNGDSVSGIWREVLRTGSNSESREILKQQKFWDYNYPCFEGFVIKDKVLYQLSVEEDYSYSGKLCFSIYDSSGKRIDNVVRIQNNDVVYLH